MEIEGFEEKLMEAKEEYRKSKLVMTGVGFSLFCVLCFLYGIQMLFIAGLLIWMFFAATGDGMDGGSDSDVKDLTKAYLRIDLLSRYSEELTLKLDALQKQRDAMQGGYFAYRLGCLIKRNTNMLNTVRMRLDTLKGVIARLESKGGGSATKRLGEGNSNQQQYSGP